MTRRNQIQYNKGREESRMGTNRGRGKLTRVNGRSHTIEIPAADALEPDCTTCLHLRASYNRTFELLVLEGSQSPASRINKFRQESTRKTSPLMRRKEVPFCWISLTYQGLSRAKNLFSQDNTIYLSNERYNSTRYSKLPSRHLY